MAETLVSKIVANAGKNWSRNTVADGNWLNANTIVKLNQNDKTLAEAIDDLSASMPHILPEYPGFELTLEPNETIKSIEQKTTGELIVEKQPINIESSTLNDKLWAHLNTNDFKELRSEYEQLYYNSGDYSPQLAYVEPGRQGDGCTTTALGLIGGIYSIYLELSYKLAEQDTIEAIEKEVFVGLYNGDTLLDEISFHVNDTYKEMEQHRLINAVVKFATAGTLVIKGKTETGHRSGGLKINNLYIVSVGGATGPKGDRGAQGDPGTPGTNGKTPELTSENHHIKWKYTDASTWTDLGDFQGDKGDSGDDGKSLSATSVPDSVNRQTQVKIGQVNGSEQTSFNLPWGVDGTSLSAKSSPIAGGHRVELWEQGASQYDDSFEVKDGVSGTSVSARVVEDHANKKSTVTLFDPYSSQEHIIQTFEVKDGNDGQGFIENHYYSQLSAHSADNAQHAVYADYATYAYIDSNTSSAMSDIVNELHGKLDTTIAAQTYQSKTLPVNIGSNNILNMPIAEYGNWGDNADGYLVIGNNSKVGNQSYVLGNDSVAQKNSIALNGGNSALHDSIAQGWKCIAIERSQAFGYNSSANDNSLAAGYSVVATECSFAGGQAYNGTRGNILAHDHSFALGVGSNNEPLFAKDHSFSFGYATSAKHYAFAFGKAIDVEGSDGQAVFGVGRYNEKVQNAAIIVGNGTNNARNNAFVVYNDGNVSAKNYKAEGYTQNNTYVEASVPKSLPNTGDSSMVVQKMFVCTSDPDIVAHAALANGEGCIFFRVGS